MFVQVIQGKVNDASALQDSLERWLREQSQSAEGWLGSTGGLTNDGGFIMLVRFDSEEAARRNSDRPEQGEWWAETAKAFDGEPTFDNSTEVDIDTYGDPDRAGFVQVMRGQMSDPDRARELMRQDPDGRWQEFRPDILGSVTAVHDGGRYTSAIYFTSEAEARQGEAKEMPDDMKAVMEEMGPLFVGETEYFDLTDPWLHSADRGQRS
jgi:hypothetical protein